MTHSANSGQSGLADIIAADARLIILQELARQVDARLNDAALTRVLDVYGIRRPREWVRTQINQLAMLDAVHAAEIGDLRVAELRRAGRDHVERRAVLDGVSRPADG